MNVVFVQNLNGEGNFSTSNTAHMDFWNKVFENANHKLEILTQENCNCSTLPLSYQNIHIEFVPNYIEVKDNWAWDHSNDIDQNNFNSYDKPYLNFINGLAEQAPGYQEGINMVITTDGPFYNKYVYENPDQKPLWDIGYTKGQYDALWYSAYPTYDLTHQATWHAPDEYLWYINGFDHIGGQWWLDNHEIPHVAGSILHELGHYFNLGHENSCVGNIMQQSSDLDRYFTGCQVREMYQTLMTKTLRQYVTCEDKLDFSLEVNTNETWNQNLRIFGNIVVKNGATLTVKCQLHMSPQARILVERGGKLVVDGGLITGDCGNPWKGIVVEGDVPGKQALSGKVTLKNGAILEHARDAVSMNPDHIPWNNGVQQTFYGGLIEAQDATIRNCVRGVEFMRYGKAGIKDNSWFKNVTFENIDHQGVSIWADDGVTFDNCIFSKIGKCGILPYDCEVKVHENNTFEEQPAGVDVITTYPIIFSPKIGALGAVSNTFNCVKAGVNIQSAGNIEPLSIVNGVFNGSINGIKHNGNALLQITNNELSGHSTAIELNDAGNNYNIVKNNEIKNSYIGSQAINANDGLRYLDNCFSNDELVDIGVTSGAIFPYQGDNLLAAGNCFTKDGVPELDNDAGSSLVFYYIKQGTPQSSCKFPVNLHNATLVQTSLQENATNCGPDNVTGGGGGDEVTCSFDPNQSITQLRQLRFSMYQQLVAMGSEGQTLAKANLARCIETLEALIGRKMLDPNSIDPAAGKEMAITFFNSTGMDFKDKTTAYGIMVDYAELVRARNYLNTLSAQSTEQSNFIAVQNINLDYLENQTNYQLTENNKAFLYAVGNQEGAYKGYARSLYEVLTGERINVEIPEIIVENRSESVAEAQVLSIYPNPSSNGLFNLRVAKIDESTTYNILLTDITGRIFTQFDISKEGVFPVGNKYLTQGVYFLTVKDQTGKILNQSKMAVIH